MFFVVSIANLPSVRRVSGPAARKRLNALFECVDRSRPPVLMLVDELDQLSTKKQEVR